MTRTAAPAPATSRRGLVLVGTAIVLSWSIVASSVLVIDAGQPRNDPAKARVQTSAKACRTRFQSLPAPFGYARASANSSVSTSSLTTTKRKSISASNSPSIAA